MSACVIIELLEKPKEQIITSLLGCLDTLQQSKVNERRMLTNSINQKLQEIEGERINLERMLALLILVVTRERSFLKKCKVNENSERYKQCLKGGSNSCMNEVQRLSLGFLFETGDNHGKFVDKVREIARTYHHQPLIKST